MGQQCEVCTKGGAEGIKKLLRIYAPGRMIALRAFLGIRLKLLND